ncbi:MAG TPA: nitric oxide reductase activation protein NorD [Candidatus Anoxymicrobiaceae bacterium]
MGRSSTENDITTDVVTGFLTRYVHRVTDEFDLVVSCDDKKRSYYRPDNRTIVIGDVDEDDIDLVLAKGTALHECGHVMYTPRSLLPRLNKLSPGVRLAWNLLEDARIELALMNKVPRGLELLTYMNETDFRNSRGRVVASHEKLWSCFWQLAKLGELRRKVTEPKDGILTKDEIVRRAEKARPMIAHARYERDPAKLVGYARRLWDLMKDLFTEVTVLVPMQPQAFSDDEGSETPEVHVDVGGGAVPGDMKDKVTVQKPRSKRERDEEEDALKREIEKEIRERSEASSKAEKELEEQARKSSQFYRRESSRLPFAGRVEVCSPKPDAAEYERLRREVMPVARKLEKALKELARKEAAVDMDRGLPRGTIDPHLAHRSQFGDSNVFRRVITPEEIFPVVEILVDESGSMSYMNRYRHARRATIAVHEALRALGIRHAITGFTSGGTKQYHHVFPYMLFGEKPTRTVSARLAAISSRDCNRDGLAIRIAGDYLARQRANRRLLLVVSDGLPNACRYGGALAVEDTRRVVKEVERQGIYVMCIYIGQVAENDIAKIYSHYAFVESVSDLPARLAKEIHDFAKAA